MNFSGLSIECVIFVGITCRYILGIVKNSNYQSFCVDIYVSLGYLIHRNARSSVYVNAEEMQLVAHCSFGRLECLVIVVIRSDVAIFSVSAALNIRHMYLEVIKVYTSIYISLPALLVMMTFEVYTSKPSHAWEVQ
ncbi:hypothetical protein Btru_046953 [Bulinus truncatus]|nr:hypothetical protein Btru_046953 [Bulinus truncatus]